MFRGGESDGQIGLIRQFRYEPYGRFETATSGALTGIEDGTGSMVGSGMPLETWHGFQGLWYDRVTGLYNARNRIYNPPLARFNQRDPNGQALVLASVLARNAQTMSVFASMSPGGQYTDGMHLYQFVGGNPIRYHDPDGMQSSTLEMAVTAGLIAGLATIGIVATNSLIDQIAELTGNIVGYQAASYLASMDIDLGLAYGQATFISVQAMVFLEVSSRQTAMTAAALGTLIVSTGTLPLVDIAVYSHKTADAERKSKELYRQIYRHAGKISTGGPGDPSDHWKKEIAAWLQTIGRQVKRMKPRRRVPWEKWIEEFARWLENPKGPPPPRPV